MINTSQIFLRYFPVHDETKSVYISISDLDYSGVPIDQFGDDMDSDTLIYVYNRHTEEYEVLDLKSVLTKVVRGFDMDDKFGDDLDARHDAESDAYEDALHLLKIIE